MPSSRLFSASAALIATLLLATACTSGSPGSSGGITVSGAWARPAPAGTQPSGAYLTMTNTSAQADALLKVSSPVAGAVEIHETSTDDMGMTGMHPMARVEVAAGATVKLQPGGMHLMVMGLTKALQAGDTIELRLEFEHAGTVVTQAEVRQD